MESHHIILEIENIVQERRELYLSPLVEIVEIKVEKGFAASPVNGDGFGTGNWGSGTW